MCVCVCVRIFIRHRCDVTNEKQVGAIESIFLVIVFFRDSLKIKLTSVGFTIILAASKNVLGAEYTSYRLSQEMLEKYCVFHPLFNTRPIHLNH